MENLTLNSFFLPSIGLNTSKTPLLKPGASSSSEVLNKYFKSCSADIMLVAETLNRQSAITTSFLGVLPYANTGMSSVVNALSARVSGLSVTGQAFISMHTLANVVSGDTTVSIDKMFGQATLPISASTDLLVYRDLKGNKYIPEGCRVYTAVGSGTPTESDWTFNEYSQYILSEDAPLIREDATTGARVGWIRIDVPQLINGLPVNCIEIYPCPAFNMDLEEVAYQAFDESPTSTWTTLDLTYLPGYNPTLYSNSYVNEFGPIRLLTDELYPRSIRLKVRYTAPLSWGVAKFKLRHLDYLNTGTLKLQNPYSANIGTYVIRGQGPNLTSLGQSVVTNQLTLTFNKVDTKPTPVVTGVHIQSYV